MTLKGLMGLLAGMAIALVLVVGGVSVYPAYTTYQKVQATNQKYELKVKGLLLRCEAESNGQSALRSCIQAVKAFHNGTYANLVKDIEWWHDAPMTMAFGWTEWIANVAERLESRYRAWLELRGWREADRIAQELIPKLKWSQPA